MSVIKDMIFGGGGDEAAKAATEASQISADYQRQALDYLKQTERLPQAYRDQALAQLGSLYGLPGPGAAPATTAMQGMATAPTQGFQQPQGVSMNPADYGYNVADPADARAWEDFVRSGGPQSQAQQTPGFQAQQPMQPQQEAQQGFSPLGRQDFVAGLREDPFYLDLLGAGEEAVLRGASATGGLRSGTASENLARNNQSILRGLYGERVAGLQGMAGTPSYAPQIAQGTAGIGQTLAQGGVASAQALQAGQQQSMSGLMGLGSLGLGVAKLFI
jgi:hypothetical protein